MGCSNGEGSLPIDGDNYILAYFYIGEEKAEEEHYILNNLEEKIQCVISINDQVIPFSLKYKFPKEGEYKIKYSFKSPLIEANRLFLACKTLGKVDLTHFQTQKLKSMKDMFSDCKLLREADFSGLDLQNVIDISGMFSDCGNLDKVDFSNIKTKNLEKMEFLFKGCKYLDKNKFIKFQY